MAEIQKRRSRKDWNGTAAMERRKAAWEKHVEQEYKDIINSPDPKVWKTLNPITLYCFLVRCRYVAGNIFNSEDEEYEFIDGTLKHEFMAMNDKLCKKYEHLAVDIGCFDY